jgi:hypothetical protein
MRGTTGRVNSSRASSVGAASGFAKSHPQQQHPHSSHSHLSAVDSGGPRTLDKAWSRARRTPTYTPPSAPMMPHQAGLPTGHTGSGSHLQPHREDPPQPTSGFALHEDNLRQLYPEVSGTSPQLGMGEAPVGGTSPCPQPSSPRGGAGHQGPRLLCRAPSMARSGVVGRRSTGISLQARELFVV